MADLLLGARMTVAGGRDGWARTVLTALGVGLGVVLLLLAAAVPGALDARSARADAREAVPVNSETRAPAAGNTMLVDSFDTNFRGRPVRGLVLRPEGPKAPIPPGVAALPRAGELVASPALRDLLASPDGTLLAQRLGNPRITGAIGEEGLKGPGELAFYLGSDALVDSDASRVASFGGGGGGASDGLSPVLMLLVVVIFVVLLAPIAAFVGAAARFGGERRDRRLAALRLVGADLAMTHRIAAGETMVAAMLGVAVGGLLFMLGRQVVPLVTLWDISVYAGDVRPGVALVPLIMVAVPALAVAVTLIAMRGVTVEPLGVVRRGATVQRRLWWRLVLPGLGLALLLVPLGGAGPTGSGSRYQVAAGTALLLAGTVTLLPWLIDVMVRRMGGGPVPWQLAIRRLQLDSATSARLVNGIAVAVAGTIGLQMMFAAVQREVTEDTGQDLARASAVAQVTTAEVPALRARLLAAPGITGVSATAVMLATPAGPATPGTNEHSPPQPWEVRVGDCAALAQFASLDRCADGDVFLAERDGDPNSPAAGSRLTLGSGADGPAWTVPTATRTVPARPSPLGHQGGAILATPGAMDPARLLAAGGTEVRVRADVFVTTDPRDPDAIEHLRNVATAIDRHASVGDFAETTAPRDFVNIRRGLYLGVVVTLLLIGASMLVGGLEQLRERRRLLAILVAVGTRRSTLVWSVVLQTAIPVAIGLVLAVALGLALGSALLRIIGMSVSISWPVVGLTIALAVAVMSLATALSLPALWRLMRVAGLRTE